MTVHKPTRRVRRQYCISLSEQVTSGASLMPSSPARQIIDAIITKSIPSQRRSVVLPRTSQSKETHPAPYEAEELSRSAGIFLSDKSIPSVVLSPLSPALAGIRRAEKGVCWSWVSAWVSAASCRSVSKNACLLTMITNAETWRFGGAGS